MHQGESTTHTLIGLRWLSYQPLGFIASKYCAGRLGTDLSSMLEVQMIDVTASDRIVSNRYREIRDFVDYC